MIELRWLTKPHPRYEGQRTKRLQYRSYTLVEGKCVIVEGTIYSGYWSDWKDVPDVAEAEVDHATVQQEHTV